MLQPGKVGWEESYIAGEILVKVTALSHRSTAILRFNKNVKGPSPALYNHTKRVSV